MRIRRLVYVAGPMALGQMADNIKMAWDAAEELRDAGFSPLVPQDSFFGSITGKRRDHAEWLDIDRPMVLVSAAVLRLPGESKGADQETVWAEEAGIPVFRSVGELRAHFERVDAETASALAKLSALRVHREDGDSPKIVCVFP